MSSDTGFLLDTHIWLWLLNGENKLSKKVLQKVNIAATNNSIFISAISLWEISMLELKQKIILDQPILEWISSSLKAPGMNLTPLTPSIAVESCHLPDKFHGDPTDRLIVATARIEGLILVTCDRDILEYGKHHYVNVLKGN